jgi:hypothetical protein
LETYSRPEFLETKFDYRPGESIGIISPTGGGKTFTGWQLLECALAQNHELKATVLCAKPADSTTLEGAQRNGFKVSAEYPFRKKFLQSEPPGWIHWPRHVRGDAEKNAEYLSKQFKNSLNGEYWKGDRVIFADDDALISQMYKCSRETDMILTAGRSNAAGLLFALQQPKGSVSSGGVSTYHYSQPTHLFLGKDGVAANRKRFSEIAMGLDPAMIDHTVTNLKVYRIGDSPVSELLYLDRRGPYAAIIRPW